MQVRDAALGVENDVIPKSDVNKEYAVQNIAKQACVPSDWPSLSSLRSTIQNIGEP